MFKKKKTSVRDRQAFQEEAIPHLDALYGTALRLTKSEEDAEDLIQETMLKAFRYFDKYEQGTNCKAWLFKIMTNTFINRYRKQQKRKEFLVDDDFRPLQERAAAPARTPFEDSYTDQDQLFFKMFGDEVKAALEEIPMDFRMVVLLADLQDFAYKEIAEIMDCPIGTVMSRLYRGRRMLQARLADYATAQGYISADVESAEAVEDVSNTMNLDEYRIRKQAHA
ncbi:MAG: sigma-70 family RNA polymerase sigma factor [Bradymonadaceae bacterium]|nr:sigma-70 family RNA polymerase sigma factor [Lujinxingiaceae bacterium]